MEVVEMVEGLLDDTTMLAVTEAQKRKLELAVTAYMSAAVLQTNHEDLGTQTIKQLDALWDDMFFVEVGG